MFGFHCHPSIFYISVLSYLIVNEIHCHSKGSFIFMEWRKKNIQTNKQTPKQKITRSPVQWHRIFSEKNSKAAFVHHFFFIYLTSVL